jgi:hypothetical protein
MRLSVDVSPFDSSFLLFFANIGCEFEVYRCDVRSTGKQGRVILTDMDTTEKSNHSRQLCFEMMISSYSAAQAVCCALILSLKLEVHSSKSYTLVSGPLMTLDKKET